MLVDVCVLTSSITVYIIILCVHVFRYQVLSDLGDSLGGQQVVDCYIVARSV